MIEIANESIEILKKNKEDIFMKLRDLDDKIWMYEEFLGTKEAKIAECQNLK